MSNQPLHPRPATDACPECEHDLNRRDFVARSVGAVTAVAAGSTLLSRNAFAAPTSKSAAEVAVKELYATLTDDQKKTMALPMDDSRRTKISANWHITDAKIGDFFTESQQELIAKVVQGITSEDGYGRFQKQMKDDAGGMKRYSIAIFGNPNEGPFEFELTGRHLTLRADGNTVPGAAFGGPIVYGHGVRGNSEGNLFLYQTLRANDFFQSLDGEQQKKALLPKAPSESAVQLRKDLSALPGIAGNDLAADQKELAANVLRDIMKPYRKEDVDEVMEIVEAGGGMDKLQFAFYQTGDLNDDKVWDVWRVEGPTLVCHFRGAPHVHAYINVAKRA